MTARNKLHPFFAALLVLPLSAASALAIDIADTFSRTDNAALGVTEVGGFSWEQRLTNGGGSANVAEIIGESLRITGTGGASSSDPGQAIIVENLADLDISVQMRFGGLTDISLGSTYNSAGFVFRKPGTDVGIFTDASADGQIGAVMYPSGGFLIRQNVAGTLPVLYGTSPFDAGVSVGTLNSFATPGTLPASIGGLPFDVNGNGVLEESEPFELGASLAGDLLTMKINGVSLFDVTLPTDGPATATSYVALMKNRHTGGGVRHNFNPVFDNLVISGTAPPPPPLPPAAVTAFSDTFSRADSSTPGETETGGANWTEVVFNGVGPLGETSAITGGELRMGGFVNGLLLADNSDMPDAVISADLRFDTTAGDGKARRYGPGFILRRSTLTGTFDDPANIGQLEVAMLPNGKMLVREIIPGATPVSRRSNILFDSPFPGGVLPSELGGAPFDANANGLLEADEPFNFSVSLQGNDLDVLINGESVFTTTVTGTGGATGNLLGLLRNALAGGSPPATDALYDNVNAVVPEPSAVVLLGMGLVGLCGFVRRRRRAC